ncbi:hypothetical protein V6N13_051790 [Hibiscus sabdariffa]|uniref:Uncharacterized protein n=1 Tax=Hibiscus sabdariffa TaxID=183260 RepID=A0ABR2T4H8_9ROSI
MEGVISYNGSSWADQWDPTAPTSATNNSGATAKYKQKVGGGLEKTKFVALTAMKKVKQGTSSGIQWIKDKLESRTRSIRQLRKWSDSRHDELRSS